MLLQDWYDRHGHDEPSMTKNNNISLVPPSNFTEACQLGECCGKDRPFSFPPRPDDDDEQYEDHHHHPSRIRGGGTSGTNGTLHGVFHSSYIYKGYGPIGNTLTHYYNQRAIALLQQQTFRADESEHSNVLKGIMSCYPTNVLPEDYDKEDYENIVSNVLPHPGLALDQVLLQHEYPQCEPMAAYRLIPNTIARESQFIASQWAALPKYVNDGPDDDTVVIHSRCEAEILEDRTDYGLLPHRFLLDRLPVLQQQAPKVVIVYMKEKERDESACDWTRHDLVQQLEDRGLNVSLRSSSSKSDWLYLARAKTLFCAPSTFCLSAAWANPHRVFFATHPLASVRPTDPMLEKLVPQSTTTAATGLEMVPMDYLPGGVTGKKTKEELLEYLRSKECDPARHGCYPITANNMTRTAK